MIIPQEDIDITDEIKTNVVKFMRAFADMQERQIFLAETLEAVFPKEKVKRILDEIEEYSFEQMEKSPKKYLLSLPKIKGHDGEQIEFLVGSLLSAIEEIKTVNQLHYELLNNPALIQPRFKRFLKPPEIRKINGILRDFYNENLTKGLKTYEDVFFETIRHKQKIEPNREIDEHLIKIAESLCYDLHKLQIENKNLFTDEEVNKILGDTELALKCIDIAAQNPEASLKLLQQADIASEIIVMRFTAIQNFIKKRIAQKEEN